MKRKKLFIILTILSIVMLGIGGTFAYLTASATATNITQIKSGNLTMTIDGGGNSNTSFMPSKCTSSYAIKKEIVATSSNTSGGKVSFSIGMNIATLSDSLKRTTMKYALTTSSNSCVNGLIANGNFSNSTVGNDIWIVKNDYDNISQSGTTYTKTYYLYIWLDEVETQNLSGSISVNMKGTSSNNPNLTTEAEIEKALLYDAIKDNADTTTIINFSKTTYEDNTNGVYMTTNTDSGNPVYYYRGDVRNHVLFANYCWRIVRTTETGGVKLIYDGVPKDAHTVIPIEQSSYINVSNDETYPYIFDSTNKTWTSTNNDNSVGIISFTVDTAGDYVLSYSMSSIPYKSVASFYKNNTELERHWGTEEEQIALNGLTPSDVIKIINYNYGDSVLDGTVTFSVGTGEDRAIKMCNNTEDDTTIGSSAFNSTYEDAKYVGYMYGSSIDDATNTDDSTIKTVIDTWYKNNMTSYTSKLEDTVFCNDRSYTTNNYLYFGANTRLDKSKNKTPTLKCQNTRDKFTVNTSNGNGALTYPVGLITADEIAYAGGVYGTGNGAFYLYTGKGYWTLSPDVFNNAGADVILATAAGDPYFTYAYMTMGVRPVLSLKQGTTISSGSGSVMNPFIVD